MSIMFQSFSRTIESEDDVFVAKLSLGLLVFLGLLLVAASAILVACSAVSVIQGQHLITEFLKASILAAPLLVIGSGLLYYLFLERRVRAHEKSSNPLGIESPQPILCEKCGAILYDGRKIISPYKLVEIRGGSCPDCGEEVLCKQ